MRQCIFIYPGICTDCNEAAFVSTTAQELLLADAQQIQQHARSRGKSSWAASSSWAALRRETAAGQDGHGEARRQKNLDYSKDFFP